MVKVKGFFEKAYLFVILALLYAPILLIIVYSFSNSSNFRFDEGFTFEAYISIFTSDKSPALWDAVGNTFFIAAVSSVIATVMGTFAAIGIFAMGRKARRVMENVNQFPIINSEIVMAVSLMIFFVTFSFPEGYLRLIIAHIAFCTPYVVLSVLPKLESMDPNVYEAALDLGANPFKALVKVLFPMITPGIVSGFVLSFMLSMDDFIITQINKGASTGINTLSTYIYSDARVQGLEPFWYAIFSIIFVIILALVLTLNLVRINRRKIFEECFGVDPDGLASREMESAFRAWTLGDRCWQKVASLRVDGKVCRGYERIYAANEDVEELGLNIVDSSAVLPDEEDPVMVMREVCAREHIGNDDDPFPADGIKPEIIDALMAEGYLYSPRLGEYRIGYLP